MCEQETSFGGLSGTRARLIAGFVEDKVNGCMKYCLNIFLKTRMITTILNQYEGIVF